MPGGDRTGPVGEGPMTGRGAGYCSGAGQPGYASSGRMPYYGRGGRFGRGFRGRGFRQTPYMAGRPWRMRFAADYRELPPVDESEMLRGYAEDLKRELEDINRRLDSLKKPDAE